MALQNLSPAKMNPHMPFKHPRMLLIEMQWGKKSTNEECW